MGVAPSAKLSYQRLDDEIFIDKGDIRGLVFGRLKNAGFRRSSRIKRKPRVKIPRVKRLLRRRGSLVKIVWSKVCKRLKESQSHFADLFATDYLFMQVIATPFKND